jgi:hypothetical protein
VIVPSYLFSVGDEAGLDGAQDVDLAILVVGVGHPVFVILFLVVDFDLASALVIFLSFPSSPTLVQESYGA